MIFTIATFLANRIGINFELGKKIARALIAGVGGLILIIIIAVIFKGCAANPAPQIDEQKLQKINSNNERERKEALNAYFEQIDERREISDTERQMIIKKVESEKRFGKHVTADDLNKLVEEEK